FKAFNALRNEKIKTWNKALTAALNECFKTGVFSETLEALITQRPGEFARRLDCILRKVDAHANNDINVYKVIVAFAKIAPKISNKVILELYTHMQKRTKEYPRSVNINKRKIKLEPLAPLKSTLVDAVCTVLISSLIESFENSADKMDGVYYLDPALKNLPIATGMKDAANGLVIYPRYTKLPIEETALKRFYVHWKDKNGNVDIDLSALVFNNATYEKDKRLLISFSGAFKDGVNIVHSGDVRNRRGDCAEYIDVDVEKLREKYRYIAIYVHNYNSSCGNTGFDDLCPRMGWSNKTSFTSTRTWKPETVEHSFLINSNSSQVISSLIDMKENCIYVINEPLSESRYLTENFDMTEVLNNTVNSKGLTMFNILDMRITAQGGTFITDKDMYDEHINSLAEGSKIKHEELTFESLAKDYSKALTYLL
ncbi:MAG: hypothetical protein ACRDD8_00305, partial [Bacteroidales bacterium]